MGQSQHSSQQPRLAPSPEEATYLELCRTADLLSRRLGSLLKAEDLSANQYNVLRILRGSPDGLQCGEIGNRMITRDPDITRLLDRLEKRKLIERWRDPGDRRVVLAKIMPAGLEMLSRMDEPIQEGHRRQLGHMGASKLKFLSHLLQEARAAVS